MIVYWAPYVINNVMTDLAQSNIDRVINEVNKKYIFEDGDMENFKKCPAFKAVFNEVYSLKFAADCDLNFGNGMVWSEQRDENFIKNQIFVRSAEKKMYCFDQYYIFFAEQSLEMSVIHPFFEDNDFTKSAWIIPGRYNIGKWIRGIECSFIVRQDADKLQIKAGDSYSYVQFHTNEKITLKKFHVTQEMRNKITENVKYHKGEKPFKTMLPFYDVFEKSKQKKWFLDQIKQNLME